jgi:sulfur carrier protein ThiS
MKVTIQYHGVLKKYNQDLPEREEELPEGATVGELIARSGVPGEEIAFAAVDDSRVSAAHVLKEGDRVKLFQLVGGG